MCWPVLEQPEAVREAGGTHSRNAERSGSENARASHSAGSCTSRDSGAMLRSPTTAALVEGKLVAVPARRVGAPVELVVKLVGADALAVGDVDVDQARRADGRRDDAFLFVGKARHAGHDVRRRQPLAHEQRDAVVSPLAGEVRGVPSRSNGSAGNFASSHLVSCIASTSGWFAASQPRTRARRMPSELTFQVTSFTIV